MEIPISRSIGEATELSHRAQEGEIPAFIIDRELLRTSEGITAVLEAIQPESYPFDQFVQSRSEVLERYPPHLDGGLNGLSVNYYKAGKPVKLEFATLFGERPDPKEVYFAANPEHEVFEKLGYAPSLEAICLINCIDIDTVYSSVITEGTMTAFWAGSDTVNPPLHYFNRYKHRTLVDKPRWLRLSSQLAELTLGKRMSKDYRQEIAEENIAKMSEAILQTD